MFQLTLCILKPDVVRSPRLFNVRVNRGNVVFVLLDVFLFLLGNNSVDTSASIYIY